MKKSTKIAIGVIMGCMVINGCISDNTPKENKPAVQRVCEYNNIDEKGMGSYTASRPVGLTNGSKFSFSNGVEFNTKKVGVIDDKDMMLGVIAKDDSLCMYEIVVTGKQGWDKLQNPNNVYQVDSIERTKLLAYDLYQAGLPIDTEANKMVHVTHVKGHLVHTHTKECK